MAITIEDWIRDPKGAKRALTPPARRCPCGCNREIRPGDQTEKMGDGRVILADCYHAAAGELVEAYPIGPGLRVRSACA